MNAAATFQTKAADRYLAKLCDHFGTRVKAKHRANKGWVQFAIGRCEMMADETALTLLVLADDQTQLDLLTTIVGAHLDRFAFRENPELNWQPLDETSGTDAQISPT